MSLQFGLLTCPTIATSERRRSSCKFAEHFITALNAVDSTVRKTRRPIETMNCEERPPDKRDRSWARGRKVFGQIRTLELGISARIRQLAKMAFGHLRCMIAQNMPRSRGLIECQNRVRVPLATRHHRLRVYGSGGSCPAHAAGDRGTVSQHNQR